MRICLDARKLRDSGIGNYIRALLDGFKLIEAEKRMEPARQEQRSSQCSEILAKFGAIRLRRPGILPSRIVAGGLRNSSPGADLFHAPHYVVPLGLRIPTIVTIHDLIHLQFPEYFSGVKRSYARWMLKAGLPECPGHSYHFGTVQGGSHRSAWRR